MSDDLFNSVDALLAAVNTGLPLPAERARLRLAAGLTPAQIAAALRVDSAQVKGWEDGSTVPGPDITPAYARLLDGLAARFPAPEQQAAPAPASVHAPAAPEQAAPASQQGMLDQNPDGSLVMGPAAPCVQCGQPSVYRAQGRPMHLGGFCRPAAAAPEAAAPAAPAVQATAAPAPAAAPSRSPPPRLGRRPPSPRLPQPGRPASGRLPDPGPHHCGAGGRSRRSGDGEVVADGRAGRRRGRHLGAGRPGLPGPGRGEAGRLVRVAGDRSAAADRAGPSVRAGR
nr:hypothetical protein KPHV_84790 [Kitasatospora purpeofusca]